MKRQLDKLYEKASMSFRVINDLMNSMSLDVGFHGKDAMSEKTFHKLTETKTTVDKLSAAINDCLDRLT